MKAVCKRICAIDALSAFCIASADDVYVVGQERRRVVIYSQHLTE